MTGVQTCALPILIANSVLSHPYQSFLISFFPAAGEIGFGRSCVFLAVGLQDAKRDQLSPVLPHRRSRLTDNLLSLALIAELQVEGIQDLLSPGAQLGGNATWRNCCRTICQQDKCQEHALGCDP